MAASSSFSKVVRGLYQDPFTWSFLKSVGLFAVGVYIAKESVGMEILPSASSAASQALV